MWKRGREFPWGYGIPKWEGEAETTISLVFLLKRKESNSLALAFEPGFGTKFM